MNRYDKLLQFLSLQEEEISKMSQKINQLERTNLFLMQLIEKENNFDISKHEKQHLKFPLISSSHNNFENSFTPQNDKTVSNAINYIIMLLDKNKSQLQKSSKISINGNQKYINDTEALSHLLKTKNTILNEFDDKYNKIKFLLTSHLKENNFHNLPKENNEKFYKDEIQIIQHNFSNILDHTNPCSGKEEFNENREIMLKTDQVKNTDEVLEYARLKRGCERFTALIKGYIIRSLLKTDKIQKIIVVIKDTAQILLTVRHEILSSDNLEFNTSIFSHETSEKQNHETISFQHRLVYQLKHALNELHEVFFLWSSFSQMKLLRSHINQMISSINLNQTRNEPHQSNTMKEKKTTFLSSATIKRRQKMALRSSISAMKRNRNIQPNVFLYSKKSSVSSSSNSINGKCNKLNDRKMRLNNLMCRENKTKNIQNKNSSIISSNLNKLLFTKIKGNEINDNKIISNKTLNLKKNGREFQPSCCIKSKTITTSICSQTSGKEYKDNFNEDSPKNHDKKEIFLNTTTKDTVLFEIIEYQCINNEIYEK